MANAVRNPDVDDFLDRFDETDDGFGPKPVDVKLLVAAVDKAMNLAIEGGPPAPLPDYMRRTKTYFDGREVIEIGINTDDNVPRPGFYTTRIGSGSEPLIYVPVPDPRVSRRQNNQHAREIDDLQLRLREILGDDSLRPDGFPAIPHTEIRRIRRVFAPDATQLLVPLAGTGEFFPLVRTRQYHVVQQWNDVFAP